MIQKTLYRWLNIDQALADSANFLANVKFTNISGDLTAPGTPWIYYGVRMDCSMPPSYILMTQ